MWLQLINFLFSPPKPHVCKSYFYDFDAKTKACSCGRKYRFDGTPILPVVLRKGKMSVGH